MSVASYYYDENPLFSSIKPQFLSKIKWPSVSQIKSGLDIATDKLCNACQAVNEEIQRKGAKKFAATILANAGTTAVFKSAALATFGTSAPTILGVTAAAMIGRGGLELTKFSYNRFSNWYNGVSQPALFSHETAQELKAIGSKATFGLADAISFLTKNWRTKSLSELFTGAAQQIGVSGAVSFLGIGAGYGIGMSGIFDVSAAEAAPQEEVDAFMEVARGQEINTEAEAALARIEENPENSQAYKDVGAALFNGPNADLELAHRFYSHALDLGNSQAIRDLPWVEHMMGERGVDIPAPLVAADTLAADTLAADTLAADTLAADTLAEDVTVNPAQALIDAANAHDLNSAAQSAMDRILANPDNSQAYKDIGHALFNGPNRNLELAYGFYSHAAELGNRQAIGDLSYVEGFLEREGIDIATISFTAEEAAPEGLGTADLDLEESDGSLTALETDDLALLETEFGIPVPLSDIDFDQRFEAAITDPRFQFTLPEDTNFDTTSFLFGQDFSTAGFYVADVTYQIQDGDGLWRIFANHYGTDGMTNAEIQGYVDSLAAYNDMSGTKAGNLEETDPPIRLPDIRLLSSDGELTQNWSGMQRQVTLPQGAGTGTGAFRSACDLVIGRDSVTASNACGMRPGDTFQIRPTDLLQPNLG